MASEIGVQTTTIFVPLLLVIVQRLSNLARQIADQPTDLVDSEPLFVPGLAENQPSGWLLRVRKIVPELGHLNYLHTTNMALLSGAFILVVAVEAALVKNILGLVVLLIWLQLPLLEIDEYRAIRESIVYPKSLYFHLIGTVATASFLIGGWGFQPGLFLESTDLLSPNMRMILEHKAQLLASLLLLVLLLGTSYGFLWLFEGEVDEATKDWPSAE